MAARNLLSVPGKKTASLTQPLSAAIRAHIGQNHADAHPDAFQHDTATLAKLRDRLLAIETHALSVQDVIRYHAQLVYVSTKLPEQLDVSFPWSIAFPPAGPAGSSSVAAAAAAAAAISSTPDPKRAYATASTIAQPSLLYERANVLFLLGALHSALGNHEPRSELESIKRAVKHFELAAGVFSHLSQHVSPQLRHLRPACPDFNAQLLIALRDLMLAQATECVWQQALLKNLKDATIARLAFSVAELYESALEHAEKAKTSLDASEGQTGSELPSNWIAHMTVKRWHFAAAAQYRKSCDDLASNRYGDELGRLKLADEAAKKASDASRRAPTGSLSEALKSDLRGLQDKIADNYKRAMKDNDLIYLEPVTTPANLAPIAPATGMVKADIPPEISDPISRLREADLGRPLFAELTSLGVHLAISVFEDRKHTFVRDQIARRRDELDEIAASTLNSLGLPGSLQALEQPVGLPPGLLENSEKVQSAGGTTALLQLRDDVLRQADLCATLLSDIRQALDEEEAEDAATRARYPSKIWTRPASAQSAAADFRSDLEAHEGVFAQARASDRVVQEKLEEWEDRIGVLEGGRDALEANVPKPASSSSTSTPSLTQQPQILAARGLRRELEALEDLQFTRAAIVSEAQRLEETDDIRPLVLQEAAALSQRLSSTSSSTGSGPALPAGTGAASSAASSGGAGASSLSLEITSADFESLFEREMKKYARYAAEMEGNAAAQEERLEAIVTQNKDFVAARKLDTTSKRRAQALQNLDAAYHKFLEIRRNLGDGLEFYNQLTRTLSVRKDQVRQWAHSRHSDVAQLSTAFANASLDGPSPSPSLSTAGAGAHGQASAYGASASASQGRPAGGVRVGGAAGQRGAGAGAAGGGGGQWRGGEIRFAD